MNSGRVGEERGGKEMDGCLLTVSSDSNICLDKVKIDSSVWSALETNKSPLLVYLKRCSPDKHCHKLVRDSQIEEDMGDRLACQQKVITQQRLLEKRELGRDHQCQHCERKWEKETVEGI
jgi:hypothetical protein